MTTLPAAASLCELPDQAIAEFGLTLVAYLDEDGDGTTSNLIGLLAMASHSLMHSANPTPCEEES